MSVCRWCGFVIVPENDGWVRALSGNGRCRPSPSGVCEPPTERARQLAEQSLRDPLTPEQRAERARALDRLARSRVPKDQIG